MRFSIIIFSHGVLTQDSIIHIFWMYEGIDGLNLQ